MQKDGSNLSSILQAGQWRSAAFLSYLDEAELEQVATLREVEQFQRPYVSAQDLVLEIGMDSDAEEWID